MNLSHMISAEREPLRDVVRTREGRNKVKASFGDVGVGDNHGDARVKRFAYGWDHGFAIGWPDDDRVDFLLDQILHLAQFGRATSPPSVKHDSFGRSRLRRQRRMNEFS